MGCFLALCPKQSSWLKHITSPCPGTGMLSIEYVITHRCPGGKKKRKRQKEKALKQEKCQLGSHTSKHHSHSVALQVLGLKAACAHNPSQAASPIIREPCTGSMQRTACTLAPSHNQQPGGRNRAESGYSSLVKLPPKIN